MTDRECNLMLELADEFKYHTREKRYVELESRLILKCASLCAEYQFYEEDDTSNPALDSAFNKEFGADRTYCGGSVLYFQYLGQDFLEYLYEVAAKAGVAL